MGVREKRIEGQEWGGIGGLDAGREDQKERG